MDDDKEVWPPAPLEPTASALPFVAPRPALWLQSSLGLVAGILFVPGLWVGILLLLRIEFPAFAPWVLELTLGAALSLSALAGRRYLPFALTFGIISIAMAALAWLYSIMPDPFS